MRLWMSETPKAAQKWMADGRPYLMQFLLCHVYNMSAFLKRGKTRMKKALLSGVIALVMMLTLLGAAAFAESSYTVSTSDELKTALGAIAASSEKEAVIVLTGDVQVLNTTD